MAMEQSILTSTKKILGIMEDDTSFDLDILTHINAALGTLNQIGVGPAESVTVDDESSGWDVLALPPDQLNVAKSYIYLKVRMLFDPPTMSFLIEAMNEQLREFGWRLNVMREKALADAEVSP